MKDGEKLKEIRRVISQDKKCTQADFAKMIGATRSSIALMESGFRPIIDNFKRKIYEVTSAEFVDEYDYPVSRMGISAYAYQRFTKEQYFWWNKTLGLNSQKLNFDVGSLKKLYFEAIKKDRIDEVIDSFYEWLTIEHMKLEEDMGQTVIVEAEFPDKKNAPKQQPQSHSHSAKSPKTTPHPSA